jgi:hypothetical protein
MIDVHFLLNKTYTFCHVVLDLSLNFSVTLSPEYKVTIKSEFLSIVLEHMLDKKCAKWINEAAFLNTTGRMHPSFPYSPT